MKNDLSFQWDNDEYAYLSKLAKCKNNQKIKDVEYYLDFLAELMPLKTSLKNKKIINKFHF